MVNLKHYDLRTGVVDTVHSWEDSVEDKEILQVYKEQEFKDHSSDSVYYVEGRQGIL